MLPPLNTPTDEIANNTDNIADNTLPPDAPITNNTRYGSHPMVLRQRPNRTMISHLKIAALTTRENIPKVKRLNSILIKKCAKFINNIASLEVLDEYTLPRQVTNQSTALQIERRRQYLKSLTPAQRNTLLTGDPLFAFDPVVYEYVWCPFRPPLPQDLLQYFEHLPNVPGVTGKGVLKYPNPTWDAHNTQSAD